MRFVAPCVHELELDFVAPRHKLTLDDRGPGLSSRGVDAGVHKRRETRRTAQGSANGLKRNALRSSLWTAPLAQEELAGANLKVNCVPGFQLESALGRPSADRRVHWSEDETVRRILQA
jgi:hypothetical protein